MSEWQQIETAPKDGTALLGWAQGWWRPAVMTWPYDKDPDIGWRLLGEDCKDPVAPSHWMPLPEPPQ